MSDEHGYTKYSRGCRCPICKAAKAEYLRLHRTPVHPRTKVPVRQLPDALCRGYDPDLWFPVQGETNTAAKAICKRCPVRLECLEDALARGEQWGIYGGMSWHERKALRRQRRAA